MAALTLHQQTIGVFAGVGVVLVVASVIGYVLKISVAHGQPHGVIDNLNTRIKAWWAMVLVIGFAFLFGRAGVTLLFLFASFVALREFAPLTFPATEEHCARRRLLHRAARAVPADLSRPVRSLVNIHSGLRVLSFPSSRSFHATPGTFSSAPPRCDGVS